jgi:nitrate/nitrite-specific signal transduction histidine kinase
MRERATVLGGELEVRSKAGEGTIVQLRIPVSGLPRVSSGTNGGRGS